MYSKNGKYDSRTAQKFSKSWDSNMPPPTILSPLELFPSKHDTVAKAFFPIKPPSVHKIEGTQQWLHTDRLDPNFGISGTSQDTQIRRAYRRIESNGLFNPAAAKDTPLSDLHPSSSTKKKYIVVEESRLQELTRLEATLQKEKELLGEQCAWVLNDFTFDARFPLPATRNAVHNLCEQQMKKLRVDIAALSKNWREFSLANHYDRPHLFLKDSYVKCAPLSQKALKLRLAKEATDNWRLRKDRDTMLFEDDLSYLTGKYHEAQVRDKDYERYYILATRYGVLSEREYNLDPRPGKRYYIRVSTGALKFQMAWDRYWATTKLRRFRAARMIQKHGRRMVVFKRLHPIILMRLRIGKKTYYIYCFALWKHYIKLCRMIKEAITFYFSNYKQICFQSWKHFYKDIKNNRERLLAKMVARNKSGGVYSKFVRWQYFVREQKALKRRLRRLFGFPHFDNWLRYVEWQKYLRRINAKATVLQAGVRCFIEKRRLRRKRRAQLQLKYFIMMICAMRLVRFKRTKTIKEEFDEWRPDELVRRAVRMNDMERQRLHRRQQIMSEKEKVSVKDIRRHFRTRDGKIQLRELVATIGSNMSNYLGGDTKMKFSLQETAAVVRGLSEKVRSSRSPQRDFRGGGDVDSSPESSPERPSQQPTGFGLSSREGGVRAESPPLGLNRGVSTREIPTEVQTILVSSTATTKAFKDMDSDEKIVFARKLMCGQCGDLARNIERHNYDSKFPPFIKCPDINCQATFVSEQQYHNHMRVSTKHQPLSIAVPVLEDSAAAAGAGGKLALDTTNRGLTSAGGGGGGIKVNPAHDFSHFHLMLRHHKGHELLRTYLIKLHGMSGAINSFDCYSAIAEWKRVVTGNSGYNTKALSIYEMFLCEDAPRRLDFIAGSLNIDLTLDKLDAFKKRTSNNMYEARHATKYWFRELLHLEGRSYQAWTDRNVLSPAIFNRVEHDCFYHLFEVAQTDTLFRQSPEWQQYQRVLLEDEQHKQDALLKDYTQHRNHQIKTWVHAFKMNENALLARAEDILQVYEEAELERLVRLACRHEIKKQVFEVRCAEQARHEEQMLLVDDALFFAEDNILDYVFDFYTRSMLDTMWEMPELRKGMMEYAGFIKPTLRKKLLVDMGAKNEANDWFKEFFKKVSSQDAASVPRTKDDTITFIQKRMRGILARNRVRKMFVANYVKKLDPASGVHYYCNLKAGTSSWERPAFMIHLYKNSTW